MVSKTTVTPARDRVQTFGPIDIGPAAGPTEPSVGQPTIAGAPPREGSNQAGRSVLRLLKDTALAYWRWLAAETESVRIGRSLAPATGQHALIVATSLPPKFDGGVFRPVSWFKYGAENGWTVSGVTPALTSEPSEAGLQMAASIPESVTIGRGAPLDLAPSRRLFAEIDGDFLTALELYRTGTETFARRRPSVVVGTGPRFASFAAAFLLARRFNAKLVLDYRDEWTENPFSFVNPGNADRWWERRCLAAADAVLFTTEGQLRHNDAAFSGLIGPKGFVLRNGWEPAATIDPNIEGAAADTFEVAFSGTLGTMGSPRPFLADCARVFAADPSLKDKIRLRFIGRRLAAAERELRQFEHPEVLVLTDELPRLAADRLIRRCDALLLTSSVDMARYMPGKVFEYMAAGKPILVHGHAGEAASLVADLGAGFVVGEGDADGLARAFAALMNEPPGRWNTERRRAWAAQHTRQRMAWRFFELLSGFVAAGDAGGGR